MPKQKNTVRSETIISGYLIKKINDKYTHLTSISQTDIKGLVPYWIVNYAATKAPIAWLKRINKGIEIVNNLD